MAPNKRPLDRIGVQQESYEVILKTAVDCYGDNELDAAADLLTSLTRLDPGDPRPFKLLGSIYMMKHRRERALAAFESAYALEKDDPYTLVALGEIKLDYHEVDQALVFFEALFAMDPKGEQPAANRGRQLLEEAQERFGKLG